MGEVQIKIAKEGDLIGVTLSQPEAPVETPKLTDEQEAALFQDAISQMFPGAATSAFVFVGAKKTQPES